MASSFGFCAGSGPVDPILGERLENLIATSRQPRITRAIDRLTPPAPSGARIRMAETGAREQGHGSRLILATAHLEARRKASPHAQAANLSKEGLERIIAGAILRRGVKVILGRWIRPASGRPPLLSFSNLIEAHILWALRMEHGVSVKALARGGGVRREEARHRAPAAPAGAVFRRRAGLPGPISVSPQIDDAVRVFSGWHRTALTRGLGAERRARRPRSRLLPDQRAIEETIKLTMTSR